MFDNGVTPEFIPERIFDLIKLVANKPILSKEAAELLEPLDLNSNHEYYNYVVKAAIEMNLIKIDNGVLSFSGNPNILKSIGSFRQYCNSVVWKNENSLFYKISTSYIKSDYQFLKYDSILSPAVNQIIEDETGDRNADVKRLRGHRFWLSFLGLGYIQEHGSTIYFLPNMYVALKDFINIANIEINREYTVTEFLDQISGVSRVWMSKNFDKHQLSAAMSNALRTMYDKNEIELLRLLDSKEVWQMTKSDVHMFTDITHIIYKGGKV